MRSRLGALGGALGAVALAAGVLTGVSATSASADVSATSASADVVPATPIQYLTDYFWGGGGTIRGTVSCPTGSRVVSAGASAGGGRLTAISPVLPDYTAATATAHAPGYLQVTVGCEPARAITEVTSRTIELPAGTTGFRRAVVSCPAGMHAFGGGGFIAKPFGVFSLDSDRMVSNTVTADGTGWTFAAAITQPIDHLLVTTQCAPLRGSYVAQTGTPITRLNPTNVYGSCMPGYVALSGGVYVSRPDGNEVQNGYVDYSIPASGNRWYVAGESFENPADKLVALNQCIR